MGFQFLEKHPKTSKKYLKSSIIISDTSSLIALDRINKTEILKQTFTFIFTTPEVRNEFGNLPSWVIIKEVSDRSKQKQLENSVDKGEASTIALALEIKNSVLLIDEKKGRKLAKSLDIKIIGTLKALLIAKERGVISEIKPLLEELRSQKFRFSKLLLNEVLVQAKEYPIE
jgi:uncharacterized protein